MTRVHAIDFGTSNSLLASGLPGRAEGPIPLDPESSSPEILRSVLYFASAKEVHFGAKAIREFSARDLQGRLIRSIKKFLPQASFLGTHIDEKMMLLEDLIALFLRELKFRADQHFGSETDSVVMGRPARFSNDPVEDRFAQDRLEKAARLAGYRHIEFLPEPVAAAREYRAKLGAQGASRESLVLVADYGGGTSDYTLIRIHPGPFQPSDVLAIGGVALAGDSLDGALMRGFIAPHFGSTVQYRVPFGSNNLTMPKGLMESICAPAEISVLRKRDTLEFFRNVRQWSLGGEDRERMDRLFALIHEQLGFPVFEEIERVKRALSESTQARFEFDYPEVEILQDVSRQGFEDAASDRISRIIGALDETLKAAGVSTSEVDLVCCTGGTARVPALRREMESRFGRGRLEDRNFFQSVVEGLAERAAEVAKEGA
jgi:hypothetical chaperone protein